ncbi:MAG: aminotransferase class IV [Pirellulaceae bacterium]
MLESFWNGEWLPHHELHVAVDDLGFTQGVTAVERMRTYGGRVFQVSRHLQRFASTVTALQITGLPDQPTQQEIVDELLRRNRRWLNEQREAGIVLFATPGRLDRPALRPQHQAGLSSEATESNTAHPTLVAYLSPLPLALIAHRIRCGQPLALTNVVQPSVQTWPRHLKVRSRLHYFLADRQATAIDPDALGILLDEDRTVTETSVANLAVVHSGRIFSPPADRVLPGVTQAVAEEVASELKIGWEKRPLSIREMQDADEVLLFGTTTGIWPAWLVSEATGRADPGESAGSSNAGARRSVVGPIFQSLRKRFDAICAAD